MQDWRLTRHRGKWALTWNEPGRTQPFRISTGTADRGLAESRASELWNARSAPKSERVEDLWPKYAKDRDSEIANPDKLKYAWAALKPFFGHKLAKAISKDDCRAYHKARKRSDSTVRTELEMLRACLNFHKIPNKLWLPPASKPRDTWLTREQLRELMHFIDAPHVRLFVTLAVTTSARMGALLDLTWDRVNFMTGIIDLEPPGRIKTNKQRTRVPMARRARESLTEAYQGRTTDYVIEYGGKPVASVQKALISASERSGIKCSPHILRHTAGVWMAQNKVPMALISQYMGHTTIKVTERHYARFSPEYMQEAAAALDW